MNETMALYRQVFRTSNDGRSWSTAPRGPASRRCLVSIIAPGDKVLVPIFGRFGHLLAEIGQRSGADVRPDRGRMGHGVRRRPDHRSAIKQHKPQAGRHVHGDTSTTMAQPLDGDRRASAAATVPCSTSTPPPRSAAIRSRPMPGRSTPRPPACRSACRVRPAPRRSPSTSASARWSIAASTSRPASGPPDMRRRQRPAHPVQLFRSAPC